MRHAKATPQPKNLGRPDRWTTSSEADHYEKCPVCGHMIDCRDLAEVLEHGGPHLPPNKS
jgi:hypothetical protein